MRFPTQLHSDRQLMPVGRWAKHMRTWGLLTTESVPTHKILLCVAVKFLLNSQHLRMNSWKSRQSTDKGNAAFWCSDAHCSLLQPGPAATPVPGGHKPSQRKWGPRPLLWCFTLFPQKCLQWPKHWGINLSHENDRGGTTWARPCRPPATMPRSVSAGMCHKANVKGKVAHFTLAEVL